MKNILLLTDFSENAENAIDYALNLFRGKSCFFYMLNVQKSSKYATGDLMSSNSSSSIYDSVIKDAKTKIKNNIKEYKKVFNNEEYSFEGICDYDSLINSINQINKLKNIDLIVMGTNGATGASEIIFGSNTINVIRNSRLPVLAIPENFSYKAPKTILFTTEASEKFVESSLKALLFIASKFNAEIDILILEKNINIEQLKSKKSKMNDFFKTFNHNFYAIDKVPVDVAIDSFVQIKEVDFVAKIIDKESFVKRILKGSKVDKITYKTRVPLLIMHP